MQETSTPNPPLEIPNLAVGIKFWSRITTNEMYRGLYGHIRGRVEKLWVVDDGYGALDVEWVRGTRIVVKRRRSRLAIATNEELWRRWDEVVEFERVDGEGFERLPKADYKRVAFIFKK
jgi:hypothetical protein